MGNGKSRTPAECYVYRMSMSTTIEGVYRNGKIELSETPSDVCKAHESL